mgnify:CR=1 FL=1
MTIPHTVTVGEIMHRNVATIDPMANVRTAMTMMRDKNLSSLVIERRDDKDELGVVTIRDIGREVIAQNRSPDRVDVYEIMAKPVLSLPVDMDIKYGVRLLARFDLARALVTDHDGKLAGIVTMRDMVLAYADAETAIA